MLTAKPDNPIDFMISTLDKFWLNCSCQFAKFANPGYFEADFWKTLNTNKIDLNKLYCVNNASTD